MARWLVAVEANCTDTSREREFNNWYDTVHLPDLLEGTPGMLRASRYETLEPQEGRGKFLALYEVETEDIGQTIQAITDTHFRKLEEGRISDLLAVVSLAAHRQITAH